VRKAAEYLALTAVMMTVTCVGLAWWLGLFPVVHSSTGAWIMAQVTRALDVGDYAAAATIGRVPNATYNVLYPWLVTLAAKVAPLHDGAGPVVVGHVLSAAFLGLAFVPLLALWRAVGGWPAGILGGLALAFPSMVATAALIRYESLAVALILLAAWTAWGATRSDSWWRWLLAGTLVGWVYNTREYLVGSALAAVGAAWILATLTPPVVGRSRRLQAAASLFLVLDGLILGTVVVPAALGFWPQNGLVYLLSYAEGHGAGPSRFATAQLYDLPRFAVPFAGGFTGFVAAGIRFKDEKRRAVLVLAAVLVPFLLFPFSRQQSPQYYLLAKVVLVSGWAGWIALVPWPRVRWAAAGLIAAAGLPLALKLVPPLASGDQLGTIGMHSEAWPARPGGPAAVVDWANDQAGKRPLVVVTSHIENLDALFVIRHHRPVASLYDRNWRNQIPQVALIYDGEDLLVLTVSSAQRLVDPPDSAELVGSHTEPNLLARLYRVEGRKQPPNWRHPGYPCLDFRGVCLQRDWLHGGPEAVRQTALHPGPEYAGGLGPGRLW